MSTNDDRDAVTAGLDVLEELMDRAQNDEATFTFTTGPDPAPGGDTPRAGEGLVVDWGHHQVSDGH